MVSQHHQAPVCFQASNLQPVGRAFGAEYSLGHPSKTKKNPWELSNYSCLQYRKEIWNKRAFQQGP